MKTSAVFLSAVSSLALVVSHPAFAKIEFVKPQPKIVESVASYSPGNFHSISTSPQIVMPQLRGISQFGGVEKTNNPKTARPWCGPSPQTNTMNCFDLNNHGAYLQSFPIPGKLSSTPLYAGKSWLIGTNKGFLMRIEANPYHENLPKLTKENFDLWGSHSRDVMTSFRPKPIYVEGDNSANPQTEVSAPAVPRGVKWIFPAASAFLGTPVLKNGLVYVFSASQYFQAFNWESGRLEWAVRLAPSTTLRLNSNALLVTDNEVFVGNSLGTLMSLNPTNGAVQWTWTLTPATESQRSQTGLPAGPDKFYGIVASPLIYGENILISNAESMTQVLSLKNHALLWSYPLGSVASAKEYKDSVLLGSSNGKVVRLDKVTGKEIWSRPITDSSPIMSLALLPNDLLLATTSMGQVTLIDAETGDIIDRHAPIGSVNGEFFADETNSQACLSFAADGFRCFQAKL